MSSAKTARRSFLAALAAAGLSAPAMASRSKSHMGGERPPQGTGLPIRESGHDMAQGRFGAIHYHWQQPDHETGKTPLLCLHASPGSGISYSNFLKVMGTDRLVLAADHPGYGLSDRPATPSTIEDFAGAMSDLLDALGLKQVDLIGSHTGSATAVELARQRPDAVRRVILHSALLYTPDEITAFRNDNAPAPSSLDMAAEQLAGLWPKFARVRQELGDPAAWELFLLMNRDPLHSRWGYDASLAYDFAGTFRRLSQPILVLNSHDVLYAVTARARGLAPNIEVTDLPWTSGLFSAHSADIAPLVRAHLDR